MTQANDSILVTPGTGATVATHSVASKEHQLNMLADAGGHIYGTKPTWHVATGNQASVAAARTTHLDFFNASGSGVILRIWAVYIIPGLTVTTGIGCTFELIRTSTVGTGGTIVTPGKLDTANVALPAQVTARIKPTGGATTDATNPLTILINTNLDEAITYASMASTLNHLFEEAQPGQNTQTLTVREGEGFKVDQTLSTNQGTVNTVVIFTVE